MFLNNPGKPTKSKRTLYLLASIILGLLLSVLAHALIEINYIAWALKHNYIVRFYGSCALPPLLQIMLIVDGVAGGFWLGQIWWKKVYIQRIWSKKRTKSRR